MDALFFLCGVNGRQKVLWLPLILGDCASGKLRVGAALWSEQLFLLPKVGLTLNECWLGNCVETIT